MTNDEIFKTVRTLLVDALSVDDDEINPQARLQADLGAESIDMLDIVFRLERVDERLKFWCVGVIHFYVSASPLLCIGD